MAEAVEPSPKDLHPEAVALLVEAEAQLAALGKAFDAQRLTALRTLISGYPDMGGAGAGEVVASLFMLLDRLVAGGRLDREALAVHVRAWRLLQTTRPDAQATTALLDGLRAIRNLYADAQAA